jgi:hypothetical protein
MADSTTPGLVPGGLLAHLYLKSLIRQPEVAVTRAITWLCTLPGGSHALDQLILSEGLVPGSEIAWYADVPAPDLSRTDIEASWGEPPRPRVVIEAKLDHTRRAGRELRRAPADQARRARRIRGPPRCRAGSTRADSICERTAVRIAIRRGAHLAIRQR